MATPAVELNEVIKDFPDGRGETVRAMDQVSLNIREGEFFALLGPSGCGKTTTLRTIAGFEQPSSGEVRIRGEAVQGVPPFHRPVNTVFQDYALFPHMSVLQNIMFGLKMSKVNKKEAKQRAEEALELVQLPQVAGRKPSQLSGGQRQRVALARALVNRPAVLLLDEPLGALDLKLRNAMQFELKSMQKQVGITFIFVTHDQEEAMTMADRIAVMSQGKVLQVGSPAEIYEHPTGRFVADFIGETNFLEGTLEGLDGEIASVDCGLEKPVRAHASKHDFTAGDRVSVTVRPEKLRLTARPETEANASPSTNRFTATIAEAIYIGTNTRYELELGPHRLAVRVQNADQGYDAMLKAGSEVKVIWAAAHSTVLPWDG